jgi:hypothetical protein
LFNFTEEKNRDLSERILGQADYDTINDKRDKLREGIHRYKIENQR